MERSCSCAHPILILSSMMMYLLLNLTTVQGALCPARVAYVPEQTLGDPDASMFTRAASSAYQEDCCASGRIASWTAVYTEQSRYVAQVSANCTDGSQISTPLFGFNGTGAAACTNKTNDVSTVFQSDDEGVFVFRANSTSASMNAWIFGFMAPPSAAGGKEFAVSCPAGTKAIGVGARSGCESLTSLQVICANTNDTQNNLGGDLDRAGSAQCSMHVSKPSLPSRLYLGNPNAWSNTQDPASPKYSSAGNATQTECCPVGEGIAHWTLASSLWSTNVSPAVGYLQGQCTGGTLLAPLKYGFNGTNSPVCNQQKLGNVYHYNTSHSQEFFYSFVFNKSLANSGYQGGGDILDSFMFAPATKIDERTSFRCDDGQDAVGYSGSSSCFSLSNVSILCGKVNDSAKATFTPSGLTANPPLNIQDGMCPTGTTMVPASPYPSTDGATIGKIGFWYIDPIAENRFNQTTTMHTGTAGLLKSACCPSGQAITAFNVWPANIVNRGVGKVSAICSSHEDGRETSVTSEITYGYNGTSASGESLYCPNSTVDSDMSTRPLVNASTWNYRPGWMLETIMEWPNRVEGNVYGSITDLSYGSCPDGLRPVGMAARSSCWSLSEFKVSCGRVTLQAVEATADKVSHDLGTGDKAGIAVGAILAAALAAFAVYIGYRAHKRKTCIGSRQLFNLNGPAGFHSGVTTPASSVSSRSAQFNVDPEAKLLSTGLMTIEEIDCSNDSTPVSFEGVPEEWEIKQHQIKLHCYNGKPIELGRGGFGVVLYGTVHKEDVAIKMIKGRSNENELLKEIAILERAKTQFVVRFLGYSVCPDGILLAMEYMRGGTLWHALHESVEFQWYNRGQQAFKDICKGLYALHSHRIAHLDMKTPNVLIAGDCTCKISDLGLSKLMKSEANTWTADSVGSLAWMAPERMSGRCGFSSDIWALSTIIWEICTLKEPTREALPSNIKVPGEAPQAVVDLMTACRRQDPSDRPLIGTICDLLDSWDC